MLEICPPHDCTGCTACASICSSKAIVMTTDEWGFPHPNIDQTLCTDCGACKKVCPALNEPRRTDRLDPEQFYASYHKDERIRMASSSGGAFSALASAILKNGGVICGASFDEEYRKVKHIIVRNEEEMERLRTSKYTQSFMGDCFKEVKTLLKEGQQVLFSGTPCQTAGLHLYLRKDYPNLTTLDIVCHGVPSPSIYDDYISFLNKKFNSPVNHYTFRDKKWSWYRFNMKAEMASGEIYYGTWEGDPYFRGFLNDYFLRECCYQCKFSKHFRYADITLSDFWGYDSSDGGFRDDDKGISMCMCSTQKGAMLLNKAKNELIWCVRPKGMSLSNGGFNPREQSLENRTKFLNHYRQLGFEKSIQPYFPEVPIEERFQKIYKNGRLTWHTHIDAILVISSNSLVSEREKTHTQLQLLVPDEKIHYISASKGISHYNCQKEHPSIDNQKHSDTAEYTLSYAKAIRYALSHPEWNTVLILKDNSLLDAPALFDSTDLLNAFIEGNPLWETLYLGIKKAPHRFAISLKSKDTHHLIGRADAAAGDSGILIHRRALATIAKKLPKESSIRSWLVLNKSIDYWLKNYFSPFARVYILSPNIVLHQDNVTRTSDHGSLITNPITGQLQEEELEHSLKLHAPFKKWSIRFSRMLHWIFRI